MAAEVLVLRGSGVRSYTNNILSFLSDAKWPIQTIEVRLASSPSLFHRGTFRSSQNWDASGRKLADITYEIVQFIADNDDVEATIVARGEENRAD
ncbi:MAG: hypothetical protein IVW54_06715 [Candidatus Binataceae bacterium]|nr:hypothetical protein [Candidatus Binataceae bacterium]